MPISAASISAQDVGFFVTLNGRTWRWKTRMDVSGSVPAFQIVDILTPFGVLRDSIPLPGEVVQGMSDSITTLLANFKPSILLGPPSTLTFSVDEGRGFSLPQTVVLTNNGVFGSLLSASLVSSAAFVTVSPNALGHLAFNQSGSFEVAVDSTDLQAVSSPYNATVSIQDQTAPNSPQTLPVTIIVRPKAVIAASPLTLTFNATRPLSGPFPAIPSQIFSVQNTGPTGSVLDYQIVRLTGLSQNWLESFLPVTGTLNSSQAQDVTVTVAPVEGLLPGTYTETLRISGYSFNSFLDVTIQLVIS